MAGYSAFVHGHEDPLLDDVQMALSLWQRFRGLMMRRDLPAGSGLYFPDCTSIHCFFMRFPIDVAWLDEDGRVVKLVPGLRPWRVSASRRAHGVLEMRAGCAADFGLEVGDRVRFVAGRGTEATAR